MATSASIEHKQSRLYSVLGWVWLVFTTVMLALPGNALPKTKIDLIPNSDKWIHVLLFALLAGLWLRAQKLPTPTKAAWVAVLTLAYGIAMEFVQKYWVPRRSFDVMDIWADAAGALLGAGIVAWCWAKKNKALQPK